MYYCITATATAAPVSASIISLETFSMLAAPSSSATNSVAGVTSLRMAIPGVGGTWYLDRLISRVAVRDAVKVAVSFVPSEHSPTRLLRLERGQQYLEAVY